MSSDNVLVDGGIASVSWVIFDVTLVFSIVLLTFAYVFSQAPEIGTYNQRLGPGLGIEQMGIEPDILVDNNPRTSYLGEDTQLEHAMKVLKEWLKNEPLVVPKAPATKRNMAYDDAESCTVRQ